MVIVRISGGDKVVEAWEVYDEAGVRRRLGTQHRPNGAQGRSA
jgi:hypothetical protein